MRDKTEPFMEKDCPKNASIDVVEQLLGGVAKVMLNERLRETTTKQIDEIKKKKNKDTIIN